MITDKLVGIIWQIAIGVLDRYMDGQIDRVKDPEVRDRLHEIERVIVEALEGPFGRAFAKSIARPLAVKTMTRWMENREDTKHWG